MPPPNQPFYRDAHLIVDLRDKVVILDSQILTLTCMEYRLLALLVEHAAEVVPRPILLMLTTNGGCAPVAAAQETGDLRWPIHRNGYRSRIPFSPYARALGLCGVLHGQSPCPPRPEAG